MRSVRWIHYTKVIDNSLNNQIDMALQAIKNEI